MYRSVVLAQLKEEFAFKYRIFFRLLSSLIYIVMWWFIWTAIFASSGTGVIEGFTLTAMITYMIVANCIGWFSDNMVEYWMEDDVKTGDIATLLIKPFKYPLYTFFLGLGRSLYNTVTAIIPVLLIGIAFFNMTMPVDAVIFFISAALGFLIEFLLAFIVGLWAFWTSGSIWGLRHAKNMTTVIFSGAWIPLAFFPAWLASIANFFPFKSSYSTPLLIYLGTLNGAEMLYAIAQQLFWVLSLSALSYFIWRRAERRIIVQGG